MDFLEMRVLEFGGASVTGAERLEQVARLVAAASLEDEIWLVVSAQAGVTDRLHRAAEEASAGRLSVEALRGELGVRHLGALEALRLDRRHHDGAYRRAADELHRRLIELTEDLRAYASRKLGRPEILARILAAGERLSASLVAAALCGAGLEARTIDAPKVPRTRGPVFDAETEASRLPPRELLAGLPAGAIPVFTGPIQQVKTQ
jgi:aspartokinase/homoserine dehydrogenase 1